MSVPDFMFSGLEVTITKPHVTLAYTMSVPDFMFSVMEASNPEAT